MLKNINARKIYDNFFQFLFKIELSKLIGFGPVFALLKKNVNFHVIGLEFLKDGLETWKCTTAAAKINSNYLYLAYEESKPIF